MEAKAVKKTTSLAYSWLQASTSKQSLSFKSKWDKALNRKLTDIQWRKACILSHKWSISTRLQEIFKKLLTQWYATPERLHSWYPQTTDVCWRCNNDTGSLLHIWWNCPLISDFCDLKACDLKLQKQILY